MEESSEVLKKLLLALGMRF